MARKSDSFKEREKENAIFSQRRSRFRDRAVSCDEVI